MITIGLASQSAVKIQALQWALEQLNVTAAIVPMQASSGVPDQPFGLEVTRQGALGRAEDCIRSPQATHQAIHLVVAMENGLVPLHDGRIVDLGVIVVLHEDGGKRTRVIRMAESEAVPFPTAYVEAARATGWTTTAGQLMARDGIVRDHADPHADLAGRPRWRILGDALIPLLGDALDLL